MPRIAGRPDQDRERFMVHFDRTILIDADLVADQLNADIPLGKAKVTRSDVLREASRFALVHYPTAVAAEVKAVHPSLRPREPQP